LHGHTHKLAEAQKRGARSVPGVHVSLYQVPDILSSNALPSQSNQREPSHIPAIEPHQLAEADGFLFGFPVYYGNAPAAFQNLWDNTTSLWTNKALMGKLASTFFSASSFNSGQETTTLSFMTTLANHGMIYVPLGKQLVYAMDLLASSGQPHGCSAFGAGTLAGHDNRQMPSPQELQVAEYQGRLFAQTLLDLTRARRQSRSIPDTIDSINPYSFCELPGVAMATTNTAAVAATSAAVIAMQDKQLVSLN
ncbi:flavoprotein-like protein, partial [Syncephalis fuscata]